jgi:ElaB/YqjD/DUF883 family membrane-anchored ribosome-binding protein
MDISETASRMTGAVNVPSLPSTRITRDIGPFMDVIDSLLQTQEERQKGQEQRQKQRLEPVVKQAREAMAPPDKKR